MVTVKHTFCRICEPHCPLLVDIDAAGKAVRLHPDPDHPSGGIACHKGLSYLQVHNDPDRLMRPLKRTNPRSQIAGDFVEVEWETCLGDIAKRLQAVRTEHGSNAVAVYTGNPWSFDSAAMVMGSIFQDLLDTDMRFSANTQDSASRVAVNSEVYGSTSALMVPDIYHTDYLLCLGSNPKVSRWLGASQPVEILEQNDSFE